MPKSLELSAIGFSPFTSSAIKAHCKEQMSKDRNWYWTNVKSGMDVISMHRRVALFSALIVSLSTVASPDEMSMYVCTAASGLIFAYSIGAIYTQAKKIQTIVEPYLKISCCGAEPILMEGATGTAAKLPGKTYGSTASEAV